MSITDAFHIFEYRSPLVAIKNGEGWIINGHLSFVHVIQLGKLEQMLDTTSRFINSRPDEEKHKGMANYLIKKAYDRINTIKGVTRTKRSIDWIGSAWKWIAGNPDASDWNLILDSQEKLIQNNE